MKIDKDEKQFVNFSSKFLLRRAIILHTVVIFQLCQLSSTTVEIIPASRRSCASEFV